MNWFEYTNALEADCHHQDSDDSHIRIIVMKMESVFEMLVNFKHLTWCKLETLLNFVAVQAEK